MCDATLGALHCQRPDTHDRGHVYHATTDDLGDHGKHSDETGDER